MRMIRVQIKERVARVELARGETRNAFNPEMMEEVTRCFEMLNEDISLVAVVLSGQGKVFCAGADLGYMQSMAKLNFDQNEADARKLDGMFWALRSCSVPLIVKAHGHVAGGGLGLLALGDYAVAVENTKMSFSEVKLGLAPAVISPYVLERTSHPRVKAWMISGDTFSAEDAGRVGLVDDVVPESEAETRVSNIISTLKQNGTQAMRATKRLLKEQSRLSLWDEVRALTSETIARRRVSEEGQEGLASFLEKREPKWKNK